MAVTVDIAEVLDQVAFELTLPSFAAGEFITEIDALRLAKSSVSRLSGMLTRLYGDSLFAETATLSTVADFDLVSLPSNFATMRSIHWVANASESYELPRANPGDYSPLPKAWEACDLPKYAIEANVLRFTPAPNAVYELRLAYTTGLFITAVSDTFAGALGWDEWLVADMCCTIRRREQKPHDEFLYRKSEIEAQIKDQASQRDRFSATQVTDRRYRRTRLF